MASAASSFGAMKIKNTVDLPLSAFAIASPPHAGVRDLISAMGVVHPT